MDPIWQNLPRDLVDKICNMLIHTRVIPHELKMNIQFQEMKLLNHYRSSRTLFGSHTWVHIFNSLSLYIRSNDLFPLDMEWSPKEECYYMWYRLTPEQRTEFLEFDLF